MKTNSGSSSAINKVTFAGLIVTLGIIYGDIGTSPLYIMKANRLDQVESKIMYSIFNKQPKRADTYWLLHVNTVDQPDTFTYCVHHLIPNTLIKIDFNLGFKMERRLNLYFREVLEDMEKTGETKLISSFDSLKKRGLPYSIQCFKIFLKNSSQR